MHRAVAIVGRGMADYYAKDDYYLGASGGDRQAVMTWSGKGAELLGLRDRASAAEYTAVFAGFNPDPSGPAMSQTERKARDAVELASVRAAIAQFVERCDRSSGAGDGGSDREGEGSAAARDAAREDGYPAALAAMQVKFEKLSPAEQLIQWERYEEEHAGGNGAAHPYAEVFGPALTIKARDGPSWTRAALEAAIAESEHAPGTDMIMSAPKSVSVLALVMGDERLIAAHDRAVAKTLEYIEKTHAGNRMRDGKGQTVLVQTGNLVIATVQHRTSREGDPNLHSHPLVANATFVQDAGEWRALSSKPMFDNQVGDGMVYTGHLAKEVMALGFDVQSVGKGLWEIAGVPRDILSQFSKAAARVEANYEREQPQTAAARDAVKRFGRPSKKDFNLDKMTDAWRQELGAERIADLEQTLAGAAEREQGRDLSTRASGVVHVVGSAMAQVRVAISLVLGREVDSYGFERGERPSPEMREASRAISAALQTREVETAVFSRASVLKIAQQLAPLGTDPSLFLERMDALKADGRVTGAGATLPGGITTKRSLEVEAELIGAMAAGVGAKAPMHARSTVLEMLTPEALQAAGHVRTNLTEGQARAAEFIMTTPDKVVAVLGAAGVGKTTMMRVVNEGAKAARVELFGLTPNHAQKGALSNESRIESGVVAWFTTRYAHLANGEAAKPGELREWRGKGIVLDEISQLSNADALSVLRIIKALDIQHTFLSGDLRQHHSPAAGAPARLLYESGMSVETMTQIVRQSAEKTPELHGAATAFSRGETKEAVDRLVAGGHLVEVKWAREAYPQRGGPKPAGDLELTTTAFELWRASKDENEVNRPFLVQSQTQRSLLNEMVTDHLVERGEINDTGANLTRLRQVRLVGPQVFDAGSYAEGQTLAFYSGIRAAGIERLEHAMIVGINKTGSLNNLTLERADGAMATLDLNRMKATKRESFNTYETAKGERVYVGAEYVWEHSAKERGLFTGEGFTILADKGEAYSLRLDSGALIEMSKADPQMQFVGPGYATTTNRAQSSSLEVAPIAVLNTSLSTAAGWYVAATRGIHDVTIVTQDIGRAVQRIGHETGQNLVATEEVARAEGRAWGRTAGIEDHTGREETEEARAEKRAAAAEKDADPGLEALVQKGQDPQTRDQPDFDPDAYDPQRRVPLEKSIVYDIPLIAPELGL